MKIMLMNIIEDTTSDGPGFRTSVYCSGCYHRCYNCQNPQTWNISNGVPTDTKKIYSKIISHPLNNVTFSGGDPLYQAKAFAELAKMIKDNTNKTIWCYTGFVFEDLINKEWCKDLLDNIDVLVDGKYIDHLKNEETVFRGSSNQRLIDVPKSLLSGKTILFNYETKL